MVDKVIIKKNYHYYYYYYYYHHHYYYYHYYYFNYLLLLSLLLLLLLLTHFIVLVATIIIMIDYPSYSQDIFPTALTVLLDASPRAAVLSVSWLPLIMVASYLVLRKKETNGSEAEGTTYADYTLVPLSEQDDQTNALTRLSSKKKLLAISKILHHIIAVLIGHFATFYLYKESPQH